MLGYEYLDLTEEQKVARRRHLNWAGYSVIISQLLVFGIAYVYLRLRRSSAHPRTARVKKLAQFEWWLSLPISLDHPGLRCLGDWLVVLAWWGWCVGLAIANTGNDYLHLTKAFGQVAAANLPLQFLLAMKRSPLAQIYGLSYESHANFFHRWLGRVLHCFVIFHVALYVKFFWDINRMSVLLFKYNIFCGVSASIILTVVVISANHYVRAFSYRAFYLMHILFTPLLLPLLFLHVSHLRPYVLFSVVLLVWDQALRYYMHAPAVATIERLSPSLIEIVAQTSFYTPIKSGAHALVKHPDTSLWTSNPFSIAGTIVPAGPKEQQIRIIARVRGRFTRKLASLASPKVESSAGWPAVPEHAQAIYLDFPYGAPLYFPPLEQFDKLLFIAGGVGGTFAVSCVKHLLKSSDGKPALVRPGQLKFVWSVKSPNDVLWALEDDYPGDNASDVAKCVELYLTGAPADKGEDREEEQGIEMTEGLLSGTNGGTDALVRAGLDKRRIGTGRPVLRHLIEETVRAAGAEGRTAILVCGPAKMGSIAKRTVAKSGIAGADVWLHVEEFSH